MFRNYLISFLVFVFSKAINFSIVKNYTTSVEELEQFIKKVRPIKTQHELIRVGSDRDGGYLIPNDLKNLGGCFSPGVESTASFEEYFLNRGINCFLADYSVKEPPIQHDKIDFEKKFLGSSEAPNYFTLDSWVSQKYKGKKDLILQMDIESGEYDVLLNCSPEVLKKFRIIVIEFHQLISLVHNNSFYLIRSCFNKLLTNFQVVHIHPNNVGPKINYHGIELVQTMEFTFLRKDRVKGREYRSDFPHVLDRKCNPNLPDIPLPPNWYT